MNMRLASSVGFAAGSALTLFRMRRRRSLRFFWSVGEDSCIWDYVPATGIWRAFSSDDTEGNRRDCLNSDSSGLAHGQSIPDFYLTKVPERDSRVIEFFLDYISWRSLPIDGVLINGGYVRDLLLEKKPDDLDISLCLQNCAENVTVEWILSDMQRFCASLGDEKRKSLYGFEAFSIVGIKGDISKTKLLDTTMAVFRYDHDTEENFDVDVMPTIGQEVYADSNNRIPTRDHRGSPQDDALRRDLTIGSMLLKISRNARNSDLQWTLLDYYDGLSDLRSRILRVPFPEKLPLDIESRLFDENDFQLAKVIDANLKSPLQVWWIKALREDPLRILRVFRFSSKLDFDIHPCFWKALCFCLQDLKEKVAGSRKLTEILKIAKYGYPQLEKFFQLCFCRRFIYCKDGAETSLAPAVFGGLDPSGKAHFLPYVKHFDASTFTELVEAAIIRNKLIGGLSADEITGCMLCLAAWCADIPPYKDGEKEDLKDKQSRTHMIEECFQVSCNGLCTSNEFRAAGTQILQGLVSLEPILSLKSSPIEVIFGKRLQKSQNPAIHTQIGDKSSDDAGILFAQYCRVWKTMKLQKSLDQYWHHILVAMIGMKPENKICSTNTVNAKPVQSLVQSILDTFRSSPQVTISGKSIASVQIIPRYMRGDTMLHLHVLIRMLGLEKPVSLTTGNGLLEFMQGNCNGLLDEILDEWYSDSELRVVKPQYSKSKMTNR